MEKHSGSLLSLAVLFLLQSAFLLPQTEPPGPDSEEELIRSRTELIRQQKQEKKEAVSKAETSAFGEAIGWVFSKLKLTDGLKSKKYDLLAPPVRTQGFYPITGALASSSGFSLGAGYLSPALPNTPLAFEPSFQQSIRGYELYGLRFGKLPIAKGAFEIEPLGSRLTSQLEGESRRPSVFYFADLRYKHFPQEDFFGFGPDSRLNDEADYLVRSASYDGVVGYQITPWLSTAVRAGYVTFDIGQGTDDTVPDVGQVFDPSSLPGRNREPDFLRLGTGLLLDYRDDADDPHSGGAVGFLVAFFDDRGGDSFEFNRYLIDVRQYLPLWSGERTLALRFLSQIDDPRQGARVPFYLRGTLGGGGTLRGYRTFRFRDSNLWHLTAEYRWLATPGLGLVLFYDTGKVFSDLDDFDFSNLKETFGTGARIKLYKSTIVRLDVGFSPEGTRLLFGLGQTF